MKNGTEIARDHFREIIGGRKHQKNLKRLRVFAFKEASNFAVVLNIASGFIEEDIEKTMEVVIGILEETPATVKESGDQRILEAICRVMGTLALCGRGEDKAFCSPIEKFLIPFQLKEEGEIFFSFPDGIQGLTKCYLVPKGKEDEAIFQMIADMEGSEFGVSIITRTMRESIFASMENLERDLNPSLITSKIGKREEQLEKTRKESWKEIKENRHWGIRPGGRDKILISEKGPVKNPLIKLNIEFLRFIQEWIEPPAVGIEIIFKNKKIILAKINQEGQLLAPWKESYPVAASLLHAAILLYLRDLTVGNEDTFLSVQRTRKVSEIGEISSKRETEEYLVVRREIEYIPHHYITPGKGERIRKIARRPKKILFRREHLRWLPLGWKASQKAKDRAKKAGFSLLSCQTYVKQYVSEGKKVPGKLLRDVSAAKKLEKILA